MGQTNVNVKDMRNNQETKSRMNVSSSESHSEEKGRKECEKSYEERKAWAWNNGIKERREQPNRETNPPMIASAKNYTNKNKTKKRTDRTLGQMVKAKLYS